MKTLCIALLLMLAAALTPAAAQTETPTPPPSPTPLPRKDVVYVDPAGGLLRFSVEPTWYVAEEPDRVVFASTEDALTASHAELAASGAMRGTLEVLYATDAAYIDLGLSTALTAGDVMMALLAARFENGPECAVGPLSVPFVGALLGAFSTASLTEGDVTLDCVGLEIRLDDGMYAIGVVSGPSGSARELERIVRALARTASFTPPAQEPTPTPAADIDAEVAEFLVKLTEAVNRSMTYGGVLTVRFPDGWMVETYSDAVELRSFDTPQSVFDIDEYTGDELGVFVILWNKDNVTQMGSEFPMVAIDSLETWTAYNWGPLDGQGYVEYGPITEMELGGRTAAVVSGPTSRVFQRYDITLVAVDVEQGLVWLVFMYEEGAFARFESAIYAISSAIDYRPPPED